MTSHALHGDVQIFGLVESCERCRDLAAHPDQLDSAMRERLLHGRLITDLDEHAATWLRASIPHRFHWADLAPSLCGLCSRRLGDPIHLSMADELAAP